MAVRPVTPSFRILVWDPLPLGGSILHHVLARAGHQATVVAMEAEALAELDRTFYDLLIVHHRPPRPLDLSLLMLHRLARLDEPAVPAIVLASGSDSRIQQACREAGVDVLLTTPVPPLAVLEAIDGLAGVIARRRTAV